MISSYFLKHASAINLVLSSSLHFSLTSSVLFRTFINQSKHRGYRVEVMYRSLTFYTSKKVVRVLGYKGEGSEPTVGQVKLLSDIHCYSCRSRSHLIQTNHSAEHPLCRRLGQICPSQQICKWECSPIKFCSRFDRIGSSVRAMCNNIQMHILF